MKDSPNNNNNCKAILMIKLIKTKWRVWLRPKREGKILNGMPNCLPIVSHCSSRRKWKLGRKSRRLRRELVTLQGWRKEMKRRCKRKSTVSTWKTKWKSKWARTTTCFQSRGTTRRKRSKTLYCSRKKKRQSSLKWLRTRTSKRSLWIMKGSDKKTRWKIR